MWCTIIATDGNWSIFFNNDSRVLLEKQHTQEPKYKRNSRKTKANQNEVKNKDENSKSRKCTSSLHSGNDLEAPVIFMNMLMACCIGVEIVNNFFQFQQNKWISNRSFVWRRRKLYKYPFGMDYFFQLILLFSLFLLLFMSYIVLFCTIDRKSVV